MAPKQGCPPSEKKKEKEGNRKISLVTPVSRSISMKMQGSQKTGVCWKEKKIHAENVKTKDKTLTFRHEV